MEALTQYIDSGRATDLILLLMLLEGALLGWRWRCGKGAAPLHWLSQLAAGAALVLALRMALVDAPAHWVGLALLLAGVAHLAGYRARWIA